MRTRDENYIIELCDEVLKLKATRQCKFDFLRGDKGHRLPIDAFYSELNLAIEYHERQHFEDVPIMNARMTCSGVTRNVQRRIYDLRRIETLPKHGIFLVILSVSMFEHDSRKRLRRNRDNDLKVIREALTEYIEGLHA